ncbi:MAG TPA: isoprenoid biosynthesis glyoxalase ElbB [Firmicutes bacterium]|nr:isoprenoid biosynthesis glyoxalase ElbB [Bacillota bacterium]
MSKKIGVLLSGCGVQDGSEIHESTLTLLALDKLGAEIICVAPSKQAEVFDHVKGQPVPEKRNTLIESARISRGQIIDTARIRAKELDALIIPGGTGAIKNLSNFYLRGAGCTVDPSVGKLIAGLSDEKKPMGAICIAPALLGAALRDIAIEGVKLTIGNDEATAKKIEEMGHKHVNCAVDDIVVDEEHKIVSTPAYMLGKSISEIEPGIIKLVNKIYELA